MKIAIALLLFCSACFAQDQNTTIEQNSTFPGSLPWSKTTTDDFNFSGPDLLRHIAEDHQALAEIRKLHEWLHQKVEQLRPRGVYAYIVVEADDASFVAWKDRSAIEQAGWVIVRQPLRGQLANIVAIGKQHFSHVGYLTNAKLQQFVNQASNRGVKPLKSSRARWVSKITMTTRDNCAWCDKWMRDDMPLAKADGVEVVFRNDPNGAVPRFEVCSGTSCIQYVGYKSYQSMKDSVR